FGYFNLRWANRFVVCPVSAFIILYLTKNYNTWFSSGGYFGARRFLFVYPVLRIEASFWNTL
ncbi:hypothetical protein, partial [Ethanoligenens sp.]|uniref:hypothetical protein n=1 Tax=Ethanoligenens sp. TaxID=2099655 RepID=UPI0039E7CCA2